MSRSLTPAAGPGLSFARAAAFGAARIDKVGLVVAALAVPAFTVEAFATLKANRIVSGKGVGLLDALDPGAAHATLAILAAASLAIVLRTGALPRLVLAAALLVLTGWLIGQVPAHLVPAGNTLARVSPAAGFWSLALAFALLFADAAARLSLGPWARLGLLALAALGLAAAFAAGLWDGLSVMREYAAHADSFWREARQHLALAFGSLVAALVVGVPLGLACHRLARLRAVALPVLNIVQTVPSIAMYGLLMAPLGALAAAVPALGALGVRGIGAAPAVVALFLYSLLPVVANVVVGLRQVPPEAVEAARGMGMTDRQRLLRVELPLALPVILAGVRVVLVQNIGLVAIAALIGGGGFGAFVFQGIGQAATDLVLLGAIPTIALAVAAAIGLDAAADIARGRRP